MTGEMHVQAPPARTRGTARSAPGHSQRERLLAAIIELAALEGFTAVSVGQLIARAGVSRTTFYEQFADKEECFAAALAPLVSRLRAGVREAVATDRPECAARRATHALVTFACAQPSAARLLLSDALTGGRRVRDVRDGLIADAGRTVRGAHARAPRGAVFPDLPPGLIIGVVARLLASRLCEGGDPIRPALADELVSWLAAYEQPLASHRWRALGALQPSRSPFLAPTGLLPPLPLAPGRPHVAEGELTENYRLRIAFAAAEVLARDGYPRATLAEIARLAGVEPRMFYRCFAGKDEAFVAARELLFRHVIAVTAGAYVAGVSWPERVWEAARALAQSAAQNPTLASVALLDSHAGGAAETHRVDRLVHAFTVFLHEGGRDLGECLAGSPSTPSSLVLEAIGTAVFELAYQHVHEHDARTLSRLHPHVVFIALTPFLGPLETRVLLHEKTGTHSLPRHR